MLYYDRIDIREGIGLAKSNKTKAKKYDLPLLVFQAPIRISRLYLQ